MHQPTASKPNKRFNKPSETAQQTAFRVARNHKIRALLALAALLFFADILALLSTITAAIVSTPSYMSLLAMLIALPILLRQRH